MEPGEADCIVGTIFLLLAFIVDIYSWILIARILLSWFQVDWYEQPYRGLRDITEPYLSAFRFIPPIGMLDFSPMVAIFILMIVENMLRAMAAAV